MHYSLFEKTFSVDNVMPTKPLDMSVNVVWLETFGKGERFGKRLVKL